MSTNSITKPSSKPWERSSVLELAPHAIRSKPVGHQLNKKTSEAHPFGRKVDPTTEFPFRRMMTRAVNTA